MNQRKGDNGRRNYFMISLCDLKAFLPQIVNSCFCHNHRASHRICKRNNVSVTVWHKRNTTFLSIEPAHEIMALCVLRKPILQMHMRNHPAGLDVWLFVRLFVYSYTLCVRTVKALTRLRGWAGSPEPSLLAYVISTVVWWAGSILSGILSAKFSITDLNCYL